MGIRESAAEMKSGDTRLLAYRLMEEDGKECRILYTVSKGRIENISLYRPGVPAVGDLCLARIVKLDRAMELAYLEIGGIPAFLPASQAKESGAFLQNRPFDGRLCQEDRIAVKITSDAHAHKPMRADLRFRMSESVREQMLHRMQTGIVREKRSLRSEVLERLAEDTSAKFLTEDDVLYGEAAEGAGEAADRIVLYRDPTIRMCHLYGLGSMLERITRERVHLKSGASLVITPTEAFTVIDVNSGKRKAGKGRDEEILQVNLEAAEEVAYQIGARQLSGIVLVDFINMKREGDETILSELLGSLLERLSPAGKLEDITKLGIAEITRKRSHAEIREIRPLLDETILLK